MKKVLLTFVLIFAVYFGFSQKVATEVTLSGSGTAHGEGNKIVSYSWKQISGPANPTIETPASAVTQVTGYSVPGVYVYEFVVVDANGETASTRTTVTVLAANIPPTARAESEIIIRLPTKQ